MARKRAYSKDRYNRDPDAVIQRVVAWRKANLDRRHKWEAEYRAKKRAEFLVVSPYRCQEIGCTKARRRKQGFYCPEHSAWYRGPGRMRFRKKKAA